MVVEGEHKAESDAASCWGIVHVYDTGTRLREEEYCTAQWTIVTVDFSEPGGYT